MSAIAARRGVPLHEKAWHARLGTSATRWSDALLLVALLAVATIAHGYNMMNFPFYNDDEGIYISQAWAVADLGRLAAYTYFYDHAPMGWIQIAAWSLLTGGFGILGPTVATGRLFMLALQVGSTLLVYLIGRDVADRRSVGLVAAALFALSPLGIEFHRRVLLDNIASFWLLVALWLLVAPNVSLRRIWLSALALGVGILSKEILLFVIPPLAYLAFYRAHAAFRWIAVVSWTTVVASVVSLWVLMAALKGELFPTGSLLGGTRPHVSLLETVVWQAGRDKDGGLFQLDSQFWTEVGIWARDEPVLIVGGALSALIALTLVRRHRVVALLGVAVFCLVAFLARGGVVYGFYIAPLLPLLALSLSLVAGVVVSSASAFLGGRFGRRPRLATAFLVSLFAFGLTAMYTTPRASGMQLWRSTEAQAQVEAVDWVRTYLGPTNAVMVDSAMWTDLHDPDVGEPYPLAHYYFKMGLDPEIRDAVFSGSWQNVDWAISTPPMSGDIERPQMDLPRGVLENSSVVAHFDTGGWPQDVRRVHTVGRTPADDDRLLIALWSDYQDRFIASGRVVDHDAGGRTTSEGQAYAMLQAVYVDDRQTFDALWNWTRTNLQSARKDGLLAWLWEPTSAGRVADGEAASDADQDAALALLFASARWEEGSYRDDAQRILAGIWERETLVVGGRRILAAGTWTAETGAIPVNPSYFAPYAYRVFAAADPSRDWNELVDDNYSLLQQIVGAKDLGGPAGAVPNWVLLDPETGEVAGADSLRADADVFSYDASRLQWRLAVDWFWNHDQRALKALKAFDLPTEQAKTSGRIHAAYTLDGQAVGEAESIAMYALTVPALLAVGEQRLAHTMFAEEVLAPTIGSSRPPGGVGYYDANWVWFTSALLDGGLTDLYAGERVVTWPEP